MNGDKGQAPKFKEQSPVGDYANIGVPSDGMGYGIQAKKTVNPMSDNGDVNYTEGVKSIVGKKGAM